MTDEPSRDVPDIFVDTFGLATGPFSFTLRLFRSDPDEPEPVPGEEVGRIRMSPELAGALTILLTKGLEKHTDERAEVGEVTVERVPDKKVKQGKAAR